MRWFPCPNRSLSTLRSIHVLAVMMLLLGASDLLAQHRLWFPSVQANGDRRAVQKHLQRSPLRAKSPSQPTAKISSHPVARDNNDNDVQHVDYEQSDVIIGDEYYAEEPFVDGIAPLDGCDGCETSCAGCLKRQRLIIGRTWVRADYLNWSSSGMKAPALVTTSPVGTPSQVAGLLSEGSTTTLFGGDLAEDYRSGLRFSVGYLLNPCNNISLVGTYVGLRGATSGFNADQTTVPILVRPYFDAQIGRQNGILTTFPNLVAGSIIVNAQSDFDTFDLALTRLGNQSPTCDMQWMIGYRYARLDDRLRINDSRTALAGNAQGTTIAGFDQFDAESTFHGAQLGFMTRAYQNAWSLEFMAKVAFGGTSTETNVSGASTITSGNTTTNIVGNLLALPSNIGTIDTAEFAVMSELGLRLGYQINSCWTVTGSYTFMHLSHVVRASEQIDFNVNLSQVPPATFTGSRAPLLRQNTSDYWTQGFSLGIERRF